MIEKIKVEVDVAVAMSILRNLGKPAMQRAWRRTLRKTSNWVKGQAAKAVSSKTKIPQKVLKSRIYFFLRDGNTGKVWLGLNPLEAERLGKPRQTKSGVTVAKRRFNHAWVMKPSSKAAESKIGGVFERVGKARNPFRRVKIDWSSEGEAAFKTVATAAQQRLIELLMQEVNYEILKAKGNVG